MRRDGGRCFLPGLWPLPSPVPPSSPLPQNGGTPVLICHRWATPNAGALLLAPGSTRCFNTNLQQADGVPRCSQGVLLDADMCRAFWGRRSHHPWWLVPAERGMRCQMLGGCRMPPRPIPLLCHLPGPPALPPPPTWAPGTSSWGFLHLPQYLDVLNCPKCETTLFSFIMKTLG